MMDRNYLTLDKKKLQYDDFIKFKWKTIQYLVEHKREQMMLLTKNMKALI